MTKSDFIIKSALVLLVFTFSLNPTITFAGSCNTGIAGSIITGSSTVLDPNSDSYFSSTGGYYTISTEEYLEFESLIGVGGANKNWARLAGSDPSSDLQAGGGCGNTDITNDSNGGSDYAYYSVVDPDGTADNGDEYLAFAIRIADEVSGAFGFVFLMDTDNNCSTTDPNAICGNPCFEYEIKLATGNSGGTVSLNSIDGCYGTSDCNTKAGGNAVLCNPCNSDGLQVCAGSTACGSSSPVFWVFYISFSQIPGVNSTSTFSLTPATNTSGNAIIYKSANVSDFGGIDDSNIDGQCNCTALCLGSGCSNCEQDCALACAANSNDVSFPVVLSYFDGQQTDNSIRLDWVVSSEVNNDYYIVERSNGLNGFEEIGRIDGKGDTQESTSYKFIDSRPSEGWNYYRLRQVDLDGTFSILPTVMVSYVSGLPLGWFTGNNLMYRNPFDSTIELEIMDLSGRKISRLLIPPFTDITSLPIPELTRGVYILRGRNKKEIVLERKVAKM